MSSKEEVGSAIRFFRKKKKLTQLELARKMNPRTTKEQISLIETGKANFGVDYLYQIAEVLECDVSDFFKSGDGNSSRLIIFEALEELKQKLLKEENKNKRI